ncbi:unnamed protein product [Brachionus calyciflorus]|uniref:Uncharacterized protein n=1 Tax=Brachionus calyciflorus TaxID=104777 RepID=A0A813M571_9BILA|nr:unnamed protein product [Brachionus calyciflorus]
MLDMTSYYNATEKLPKNPNTNLSNLTKGIGEVSNEEKKYEILVDETDDKDLYINQGRKKSAFNSKKEINLPKTFTTKKGALILYSEELVTKKLNDDMPLSGRYQNDTNESLDNFLSDDIPFKTVNDLQKNVLFYGLNKNNKLPIIPKSESKLEQPTSPTLLDRNYLSILNMSTKNLMSKSELDESILKFEDASDLSLKRINRGYSARRYLRNLTKNWDQDLLDTFISDGKLNENTVYEKNMKTTRKKRAEDDLTMLPQAYTFDQSWVSTAIDMRSFKILKVTDQTAPKEDAFTFKLDQKQKEIDSKTHDDPIKIFNPKEEEISYKSLDQNEKQKVLSELLFHSVLNNINKHRIGDLNNPNLTYSKEGGPKQTDKIEIHIKNFPEIVFNENPSPYEEIAEPLNSEKINSESEPIGKIEKINDLSQPKQKTTLEPIYMFGRYSGASWVNKKQSDKQTNTKANLIDELKSESKLMKPNSKIRSDHAKKEITTTEDTNKKSNDLIKEITSTETHVDNLNSDEFKSKSKLSFHKNRKKSIHQEQVEAHNKHKFDSELIQQEFKTIDQMFDIATEEFALIEESNMSLRRESLEHVELNQDTLQEFYLDEVRSTKEGFALEDSSIGTFNESLQRVKSASTMRSDGKIKSILKQEKPRDNNNKIEKNSLKNEVKFEKINEKEDFNNNSKIDNSNVFINQRIQDKDAKISKYLSDNKPSIVPRTIKTNGDLEQQSVRIITVNNKKKTYRVDPKIMKDMEHYGFKKFEKFDKKYDSQRQAKIKYLENYTNTTSENKENIIKNHSPESNLIENSTISFKLNDKSDLKWDSQHQVDDENTRKNYKESLDESKQIIKETLQRPIKPKIESIQEQTKLPKLKFLKSQDFSQSSLSDFSYNTFPNRQQQQQQQRLTTDYSNDSEYARVEMVRLKPKQIVLLTESEKLKKLPSPPVRSQTPDFNFNFTNDTYNPKKYDYSNILFKETTQQKKHDPNVIKQTSFKGLPSADFRYQGTTTSRVEAERQNNFSKARGDNFTKRTINWSGGDFDPREFFMLWSYESPPAPIVVDKTFADSLRKYAEFIAKNVLNNTHAGMCLSDDVKRALRANLERLKQAIAQGKISQEVLDEYKNIFKQVLAKAMKRKDLENVEIDDDILMKLLELPARAFEVFIDPITGKESLRIKPAFLKEQSKVIRSIVTEKTLSKDDFDVYIDPKTGEKKIKLKLDVAKKLGIPEGSEDLVEVTIDENGNQVLRLKNGARNVTIGDTVYELVTDENGKQILKMTTKQKVGDEKLDDILRLADNMSPEAKHRYLQDLLKTGGEKMNDQIRKKLIDEMLKNAENLSSEAKENFLKDLMVNLVNELPPDVAKKVLSDIMNSTDSINTELKEQMIKNLLNDLNDLPEELKEQTLKELINHMDNLSSEVKNNLLQDILTRVEESGGLGGNSSNDLRNQVLKEMLKNSQNLDEETRNKILHQVLDKITADGEGDVPQVVLEELVKQMYNLPDTIKSKVLTEVTKNLENGNLDSHVLAELLKHSENLAPELLEAIIKNSDKMEADTLKELVKNLDKLPDDLKNEMIGKMLNNLDDMDSGVKQELLKELMLNPSLIENEELRDKVMKDILSTLKSEDVLKETENMTAEQKNQYLQDLLKHAGDLSEETRQQIIGLLIKNAENLDQETKNNFLKDLIENMKDLPPDIASKVLIDLMKNTESLDADLKQKMIENLLDNIDDLPDELKQQTLSELAKNLDDLSAEQKEEIFKTILNNLDSLPEDLRQETFKALIDNMNNLSSDQKNNLLQEILQKFDDDEDDDENSENNKLKKRLKNEVLKEIVKNSQNLDEEQRVKILRDVMEKLKPGEDVPDSLMNELVKQMDSLPDEIKSTVLDELKKSIEKGNISGDVLEQMMKNPNNLPKDLLQKVIENIQQLAPEALKKFVENLDTLPEDLKNKAVQDMLKNIDNMDPTVKKNLLKELVSKPNLIKDKKVMEKAILDIVDNLEYMPENVKKDMLKDIAKNINNLTGNVKEKIMKEVFKNLKNTNDETREEIMKQLMKKMGADELEKWLLNSDLPDEFKEKILADIEKIRNAGDDLLNSDDEEELQGLSGEERAVRKRQLIDKRKQIKEHEDELKPKPEIKRNLDWLQKNKENLLKDFEIDAENPDKKLSEDQIEFVRAFNKLSDEEKNKLLETMSEEERQVFTKLTEQYQDLRQKELQDALHEAKNLAIQKLREKLALQKRLEFINFLKLESRMFEFAQQISRAFVFSYLEMLQWIEITF